MKGLGSTEGTTESETAEEYVTALYELIEMCEYGDLRDELLHDRLIVGIRKHSAV